MLCQVDEIVGSRIGRSRAAVVTHALERERRRPAERDARILARAGRIWSSQGSLSR
jgi:hypothetical protein